MREGTEEGTGQTGRDNEVVAEAEKHERSGDAVWADGSKLDTGHLCLY